MLSLSRGILQASTKLGGPYSAQGWILLSSQGALSSQWAQSMGRCGEKEGPNGLRVYPFIIGLRFHQVQPDVMVTGCSSEVLARALRVLWDFAHGALQL